jgi:hypothetical protein
LRKGRRKQISLVIICVTDYSFGCDFAPRGEEEVKAKKINTRAVVTFQKERAQ